MSVLSCVRMVTLRLGSIRVAASFKFIAQINQVYGDNRHARQKVRQDRDLSEQEDNCLCSTELCTFKPNSASNH